jgi:hypothetical protein
LPLGRGAKTNSVERCGSNQISAERRHSQTDER